MGVQKELTLNPVQIASPHAKDGAAIYKLVKSSGVLDVNSEYLYLLLGEHFADSCAVAKVGGELAGFASGYISPKDGNVLFIWQVVVDKKFRGRGIALSMLQAILQRNAQKNIRYIHATISPSNQASRSLFKSLASEVGVEIKETSLFPVSYFTKEHEEEPLIIIGPIEPKEEV